MQYQIFAKHDMSQNIISYNIPCRFIRNNTKEYSAKYITFVWDEVPIGSEAIIKLWASHSDQIRSLGKTIAINTENNTNDALMIILESNIDNIVVEFISNETSAGKLDCFINYAEQ
jgi:hypothetical protein